MKCIIKIIDKTNLIISYLDVFYLNISQKSYLDLSS